MVQQDVQDYLVKVCELQTTSDLLGYVGHASYESELAEIIRKRFPEQEAKDGAPGFPLADLASMARVVSRSGGPAGTLPSPMRTLPTKRAGAVPDLCRQILHLWQESFQGP